MAAPLTAALAQTTPSVSVFAPAAATATAQAQTQAQATAVPSNANCPTGFVCVPFGSHFVYPIDPTCSDQHIILATANEQDPTTGAVVPYVKNLYFVKAGEDYTIIPGPQIPATGPDVGKAVGALLCAGKEGAQ